MMPQHLPFWAEWARWWVEIIAALATIALVAATLLLVNKTRIVAEKTAALVDKTKAVADRTAELVQETIRSTDQLDRHHQEALLPMVYVDAELVLSRQNREGKDGMLVSLTGDLVNVGPGPATSVNLLVYPAPLAERSFYQGLIGANSRQPLQAVDWWIHPITFAKTDGPHPFTVTTKYVTLFDAVGHTNQRSYSGRRKDLLVENSEKPTIRPRRIRDETVSASDSLRPVADHAIAVVKSDFKTE